MDTKIPSSQTIHSPTIETLPKKPEKIEAHESKMPPPPEDKFEATAPQKRLVIQAAAEKKDLDRIEEWKDKFDFLEPAIAFIDAMKSSRMSQASQDSLLENITSKQYFEENINDAIKKLKTDTPSNETASQLSVLEDLKSRLDNLVMPESKGPRLRFEQARYNVEYDLALLKNKQILTPDEREQIITHTFQRFGLKKAGNSKTFSMQDPRKLEDAIVQFTKQSTPGVLHLKAPNHALLVASDPKTQTYRFYDPNFGIFKFSDPKSLAEFVKRYTNVLYNNSPGEKIPPAELELALPQDKGDFALSEGICQTLTLNVGRWFLEHPDFKGKLTASKLGLAEFEASEKQTNRMREIAKNGIPAIPQNTPYDRKFPLVLTTLELQP